MPTDLLQARYSNVDHYIYDMNVLKKESKRLKELWGVGKISLAVALHSIIEKHAKENGFEYEENGDIIPIYYDVEYLQDWAESLSLIDKPVRFEWAEKNMRDVLKAKKDDDSMVMYKTYTKDEKVEFIRKIYNEVINEFNEWKEKNA